jgi:hypothetical protein
MLKNLSTAHRDISKEKKNEKKEKAIHQAGHASKARRNGINVGMCGGMCLCRSSLLYDMRGGCAGQPIFA